MARTHARGTQPRIHSQTTWFGRWPYRIFVLRELSAVFLAIYMVLFLLLVQKVHDGPQAAGDYIDFLQNPIVIAFHVIALAFAILHTVTWFQAVPKAMRVYRGEERVSPVLMIGANYVAVLVISVIIAVAFLA